MSPSSATLTAAREETALEDLHGLGCTDGLPVVIPTPERVAALVTVCGLDPDLVLGTMGPMGGLATVEKVCINAVMAGCLPDHMPVLLAALHAICDARFDLAEVQGTTHCVAPLFMVNGPARAACGIASSFGALGPGHRANASIGRAVRLCMINIGGGRPGVTDMALLGHPGKFTYLLGEAEEDSPFPPLHTSFGFTADQSSVTVVGVEAPQSVISVPVDDPQESADRLLTTLARAIASPVNNNTAMCGGTVVVVLNPEHARTLADAGFGRPEVARELVARAVNRRRDLHLVDLGGPIPPGDEDDLVPTLQSTDHVVILVAGGGGVYSMVMPSWAAGPHRSSVVVKAVELFQACEIPSRPS